MEPEFDVCVIGGGLSGLCAALVAADAGQTVLVLEATSRWGGAVCTVRENGLQWEAGAGRVEASHRRVRALLKRYDLHLAPLPAAKRELRSRRFSQKSAPDLSSLTERLLASAPEGSGAELHDRTFYEVAEEILGSEDADRMQTLFGYDAEFRWAQAAETLESLRRAFRPDAAYSVCVEGLGALIERMIDDLQKRKGVILRANAPVRSLRREGGRWKVNAAGQSTAWAAHVVLAVPPAVAGQLCPSLARLLQRALRPVPLVRIYAQFSRPWTLARTVGDDALRQVIPVHPAQGLVMVAYTDATRALAWMRRLDRDPASVGPALRRALSARYGREAIEALGPMRWVRAYPWTHGVHVWRPGADPSALRAHLRRLETEEALFVIGEAVSGHHGWMEGAVASAQGALRRLLRRL